MGVRTRLTLNNTIFDVRPFEWSLYRGVEAEAVIIQMGSQRFDDFNKVRYQNNTMTMVAADATKKRASGDKPNQKKIRKVFVARLVQHDAKRATATLFDARFELRHFDCPFDFNIEYGEGYLLDTAKSSTVPADLQFAIDNINDVIDSKIEIDVGVDAKRQLPDEMRLSGKKLHTALGTILEAIDYDLTVDISGTMWVVDRRDIEGSRLPTSEQFAWREQPGFSLKKDIRRHAPQVVRIPYLQRHEMEVGNSEDSLAGRTVTLKKLRPNIQPLKLTQMYEWEGQYFDTLGLAVAAKDLSIDEELIVANILSRTWEGTSLQLTLREGESETSGKIRIVKAVNLVNTITRDWRRLWRFELPIGIRGMWTDIEFGTVLADGTVSEKSITCPWVDFLAHPTLTRGKVLIGAETTVSHESAVAPFIPKWKSKTDLIVELTTELTNLKGRVPGKLLAEATIKVNTDTVKGNKENRGSIIHDTLDRQQFEPFLPIKMFVVATLRQPNNASKWLNVDTETKIKDAKQEIMFLEVDPKITANFKVLDNGSLNRKIGEAVNIKQIKADAKRRTDKIITEYGRRISGTGVAHSLNLLDRHSRVTGAIKRMVIFYNTDSTPFMGVRLEVANLGDIDAKFDVRRRRERARVITGQGLKGRATA